MMQEPEQEQCGTTHHAGCACHEKGWENKWKAAVEMAARATVERDIAIGKIRLASNALKHHHMSRPGIAAIVQLLSEQGHHSNPKLPES